MLSCKSVELSLARHVGQVLLISAYLVSSGMSVRSESCPLEYKKLSMEDIAGGSVPYILGGPQQPTCSRCKDDTKWTNFCSFRDEAIADMEVCDRQQQAKLLSIYMRRNWTDLLTWSPCDLWPLVSGHTTWLMGDSQTQGFFRAVACFMMEFWDAEPALPDLDPVVLHEFSIIIPPLCVTLQHNTRICYVRIDYGQDLYARIFPLWSKFGTTDDNLAVNFGQHWHQTYEGNLTMFVDYVAQHHTELPQRILWQEMLQTHPGGLGGGLTRHLLGGQSCYPIPGTVLLDDGSVAVFQLQREPYLLGGVRGQLSKAIMQQAGFPIITSFNESLPLWWLHSDGGSQWPCVHYCHPAAYQTSAYMLYKALRDLAARV